jgi:hypothetical protein
MRDFKGMKRQRGRNRGGGGGGKPQHNANRAFESNGPDNVKVRGAAQTIFERYQQLARDASSAGDRVLAENYLQHAEHYFRTLRAMQPNRPVAEIYGRDQYTSGFDIDFEAEPSEDDSGGEQQSSEEGGEGSEGQRDDQRQQRDDRQPRDRYESRDRQQNDRPRDDRPREDRQRDDRPRDDRPRDDRQQQGDRPQGEGRNRDRFDRNRRRNWEDRPREGADQPRDQQAAPEPQPSPAPAPEPAQASPVLRSGDGDVSHAPAFLGRATPEPKAEDGEVAKPRRRRAPTAAATETEEA